MKDLIIAANFYNEIHNLPDWFSMVKKVVEKSILIVDSGSTDGTIEFCKEQGAFVLVDPIVITDGYGDAKNHLKNRIKEVFPFAKWMMYIDGDERVENLDLLHSIKNQVSHLVDMIAFTRVNWANKDKTRLVNDLPTSMSFPDIHGRMIRLDSNISFVRKSHETPIGFKEFVKCPLVIDHFRHCEPEKKKYYTNKLHAKLYFEDPKRLDYFDSTAMKYRDSYLKEGL